MGEIGRKRMRAVGQCVNGYRGRAFLYVLPVSGHEDLLKVGLTHHPLQRWSSFHARWFEAFDLTQGLLVEAETRADAQALETSLHRRLMAHRCPMPITMFAGAGGATEWYRGAYPLARDFILDCEQQGYVIHQCARAWLALAMADELARFSGIVHDAFERHCAGLLDMHQLEQVRALVDSHRAFGADVDALIPLPVQEGLGL